MALNSYAPIVNQLREGLRNVDLRSWGQDVDLPRFFSSLDLTTVSMLGLGIVSIYILLNVIGYFVMPHGRSLAINAADAWENRHQFGLEKLGISSRSLESMTGILDGLAEAAKKWEDPEDITKRKYV